MAIGNSRLGEANVGHQMMRRMGWEGAGLGATEQGIQEPIKGGDVRDKIDKYKVGVVCVESLRAGSQDSDDANVRLCGGALPARGSVGGRCLCEALLGALPA